MKIILAYLPEEEREAALIQSFIRGLCPNAKVECVGIAPTDRKDSINGNHQKARG